MAAANALVCLEGAIYFEWRRALPELLASHSLGEPIRRVFVMPEQHVARSLVVLASGDPLILQRALRLLESAHAPAPAARRLVDAELMLVANDELRPRTAHRARARRPL